MSTPEHPNDPGSTTQTIIIIFLVWLFCTLLAALLTPHPEP